MIYSLSSALYRSVLFFLGTVLLASVFAFGMIRSSSAFDPLGQACVENNESPACQESTDAQTGDENPVTETVNNVANIIAIATAVVSVIIIIVAGITTVLSAGESSKVASARDAIIYAAVGLIVVAIARSIVVFIVNRL